MSHDAIARVPVVVDWPGRARAHGFPVLGPLARLASALAVVLLPVAVLAEEISTDLDAVLLEIEAGTWLRVQAETDVVEGARAPASLDSLVVRGDLDVYRFPLADVDRLWVEERATRTASKIGLVSGALGGAAFGGLFALYCASVDDDGACVLVVPIFAAIGAASGWVAGRVIGSAVPVWRPRYARLSPDGVGVVEPIVGSGPGPKPTPRVLAPRVGSMILELGYGRSGDRGARDGGFFVRAALIAWLRGRFGVGFEAARVSPEGESVTLYGGVVRAGLGSARPPRFEVVAGLGAYGWEYTPSDYDDAEPPGTPVTDDYVRVFGGSLGVKARFPIGGRLYSVVDVRGHDNIQRAGAVRGLSLWTVGVGLERAW